MNRSARFSLVLLTLAACVASKSSLDDGANLNAGSSEDTGGTSEGTTTAGTAGTAGMTSTSGPDTATTAMTTGANPTTADPTTETTVDTNDDDNEEESDDDPTSVALDVAVPDGCAGIDHVACWTTMEEACDGDGTWDEDDPGCIAAVESCYPFAPPVISTSDLIEYCYAEPGPDCNGGSPAEACGTSFCACAIGEYPFDWTNCWHLLQIACGPGGTSDCEGALAGCYPNASLDAYQDCYQQVIQGNGDCNCPMCDAHEECEASLAECLAG